MLRVPACLLLLTSACAHATSAGSAGGPTPAVAQPASTCRLPAHAHASELIRQHGTILDAYQREGGVWLEQAPVLFNEDFDFALAMGMEGGVGAGLAAAKREENNARKASSFTALQASPALRARLQELRCCGVHVYFVVWGAERATLRTVVDLTGDRAQSRVLESAPRPLVGKGGWTADGVLLAEAQRSLADVACPSGGGD